ncbi:AAA family ATPase [Novosphingopyxis iocasae]|uniref:AAA family ATPase n=1 Tax=Novosphingopyxis iocasae TaxID=2762729 RepID=UPI0016515AE6|nr:AAA family ATPase [Novosphingopyxis iocasae]
MANFIGHDRAEAAVLAGLDEGRLHHAWLLSGPKGMGKASFALRAARLLLSDNDGFEGFSASQEGQAAALIRAGSHPDLKILQRLPKKDGLDPEDVSDEADLKRNISVDQVRSLQPLLGGKTSIAPRRVIIVDAADDLERSGANALLKNLEEPPENTVFFLVSHAPQRLLPTIRSRCRVQRFDPLSDEQMDAFLRSALPDLPDQDLAALILAAEGSPGRAIAMHGLDLGALDRQLSQIYREGDRSGSLGSGLAQKLSLKAANERYLAFLEQAPAYFAAIARETPPANVAPVIDAWREASDLAARAVPLTLDKQSVVFRMARLLAGLSAHRDARQ